MHAKGTVFVGLSGGVDSSVAALKLLKEGYSVVGVFIKVWHPDFLGCNWEKERLDAMRVAAHLDIPFLTCDAEAAYRNEVAQYFIDEYTAGRTPNPDVLCNQAVKFGAFLDFARSRGADYIATGHYVRREERTNGFALLRGKDPEKDQSYFLWTLKQKELARALFPVGELKKEETRARAARAGIPVASKKDSQGICFLGAIDIPEFLSHYIPLREGAVLNRAGEVIGTHRGAFVYTIGQRHGITITTKDPARTPYYVHAKDIESNTVTVDTKPPQLRQNETITLERVNWITEVPEREAALTAQIRYRQTPFAVTVAGREAGSMTLRAETKTAKPAAGQSCVLYRADQCLGGGIIAERAEAL